MKVKLKDICIIDWGNTSLTKKSYRKNGKYLAVSATGCDGRIEHYEHDEDVSVLSAIGAQCGKMFFPQQKFTAIKNTITLKPYKDKVVSKYLFYLFTFLELPKRGAAQPFISKGDIEKFEISYFPSLSEQQLIVTKLDKAFFEIDKIIETTKEKIEKEAGIKSSILSSFFSKIGPQKTIGEIATVIAGQSPESKYYNKDSKGLPFYQGKKEFGEYEIKNPIFWTSKITKEALKGDILLSVRAPVGQTNMCNDRICIGRGLAAIRANKDNSPEYIYYYLNSIKDKIVGNTGAVFNSINKKQIKDIVIPVPNLDVQKELVSKINIILSHIKEINFFTKKKLKNLNFLKLSILNEELTNKTK
tara:strand:- start:1220 stop:2296 length:1077 start_codon:yes stop_codon:yes gene_type:complete